MDAFTEAWRATGRIEGGYSNNPKDPGGETNHGITAKVARAWGYTGEMRDLPPGTALDIARAVYWDSMRLTEVAEINKAVALELFDTGFNAGSSTAAGFVQTALNAFNMRGSWWPDMAVDGHLGVITVRALLEYFLHRGEKAERVMLRALNAQQGAYYLAIARANPDLEDFEFGWFDNRVSI